MATAARPASDAGCYSCRHNAMTDPPPREAVIRTPHWRVAHAFNSTLPGWLVLVPQRHALALDELEEAALVELGLLQGRLTGALRDLLGCAKTYSMLLAEAEGFAHLHLHLVPRMPDQPADRRGPGVFGYLTDDQTAWVPAGEMDRLAVEVRSRVTLG